MAARLRRPNPDRGLVVSTSFTLYRDQMDYLTARAQATPRTGPSGRVVLSCSSALREIIDAAMDRKPVKGAA